MAKIYISSTFKDLQAQRLAAQQALQQLRHDVRGMESYVSSGRRPVSVCLRDVDWCDFYVGIFAWRYGYIPADDNPERLSITELEYRRALAQGKECLIFLLDERTPWVREWDDKVTSENDAGRQIDRLRQDLATRHTVSRFSNEDELGRLVNASVELAIRDRLAADLERERLERADESVRQSRSEGLRVVGTRAPDAGDLFRDRTEQRRELSRLIAEGGEPHHQRDRSGRHRQDGPGGAGAGGDRTGALAAPVRGGGRGRLHLPQLAQRPPVAGEHLPKLRPDAGRRA